MPLAKDIAMQVAAANPLFLDETSVDEEALDKEREIYRAQALNEGKPEKIVEKMVEGRDRKSTRLNSSHANISYAVFCLKKKRPTARRPQATTSARRGGRQSARL